MDFLKGAKDYARNPLGIIALFISLIYGFATLLMSFAAEKLTACERWPLIIFIVLFPVMVLGAFYRLVTNHHGKLYAPGDFKDDKSFLRTLSVEEQNEKLDKEVRESFGAEVLSSDSVGSAAEQKSISRIQPSAKENDSFIQSLKEYREELKTIEDFIVKEISSELKVVPERNIGIGGLDVNFDAFLNKHAEKYTFLEIKALRSTHAVPMLMNKILYQAVLADRFFDSNFKLILVFVYYLEEEKLRNTESLIRRMTGNCPAEIELRFIPRSKLNKT